VIEEGLLSIHSRQSRVRQGKLFFAWSEFSIQEIWLDRQDARVPSKIIGTQRFWRFQVGVAMGINYWQIGEIDHGQASATQRSASTSNNTNGTVPKDTICLNSNPA
jgi:hypothetical protein